ncbi:E6 [Puffin papillomavirus 1]|uniref:E6 n=1 Tax=Puffin papillomavirus 1 TaxID=2562557 RepID=A0AAE6D2X5_9PAPI|nr:E6 [Puffin papillomavirus 1]
MPIACTLGQVLQRARKDLLDIAIYCRLCRCRLSTVEILDLELRAREDYYRRNIAPFQGYRAAVGYRWFGTCTRCSIFRTHA